MRKGKGRGQEITKRQNEHQLLPLLSANKRVLIWRLIKERADDSVSEVPGTMSFAELQTKVLLGTSHILRGAFSITYGVIYALGPSVCLFNGQNSLSIS